jgi:hypothetical protein
MILTAAVTLGLVGVLWANTSAQANLTQLFLKTTRDDLELLATEVLGPEVRPEFWTNNSNVELQSFAADLWFDNELLADEVFGVGQRPVDWFGATARDPSLLGRNVRHDLELTADVVMGDATRPDGWTGAGRIFRCTRAIQNLVRLTDSIYNIQPEVPQSVVDFCNIVRIEIEDKLASEVFNTLDAQANTIELLGGIRGDLERLADELLGLENRPDGWLENRDATSESFVTDLLGDTARLADNLLGAEIRPLGWVGRLGLSPETSQRNLRFDVELLAETLLAERLGPGGRPRGWQGSDPLATCDPTIQSLAQVVVLNYGDFERPIRSTFAAQSEFCVALDTAVNTAAENPPEQAVVEEIQQERDLRYIAQSRLAFSYLDVAALQYMGVMPYDTEFRAWYRNFNESNMMFVSGQDFALFIDRRFTTMPEEVFRTLPTLEGRRPLTFCDANWCNGPGPTPTPTGVGPIAAVLQAATPIATRSVESVQQQEGKQLVSWNNIRVNYLLDRLDAGVVQVTLEICSDPSQIACEPVVSVFDTNTNLFRPVVQTFSGLNVYELPYGYITNVIVEGNTRFSRDIWISDPTLRGS